MTDSKVFSEIFNDYQGRAFMDYYTYTVYLSDYVQDKALIYYFGTEEKLAKDFHQSLPDMVRGSTANMKQCINKLGYDPQSTSIENMIIVLPCQCKLCQQMRYYDQWPALGVPYMAIEEAEQNAKRIDAQFKKLIMARQEMNKLLPTGYRHAKI